VVGLIRETVKFGLIAQSEPAPMASWLIPGRTLLGGKAFVLFESETVRVTTADSGSIFEMLAL
jgi:hypothetical protein